MSTQKPTSVEKEVVLFCHHQTKHDFTHGRIKFSSFGIKEPEHGHVQNSMKSPWFKQVSGHQTNPSVGLITSPFVPNLPLGLIEISRPQVLCVCGM